MNERIEEQLNDYVDGLLTAPQAAEVERYLETSEKGRASVEFLRSLRVRTDALPKSIEPRRDLWPQIVAALLPERLVRVDFEGATATQRVSWIPSLRPKQWAMLAAAAMVLIVASSGLTLWVVAPPSASFDRPGIAVVDSGAGELRPEVGYAVEIERLITALYEHREALDPDTVTTIEANLKVIDRAINRSLQALEEDPESPGLSRMLASNYRRKLELLQRASRIIERG